MSAGESFNSTMLLAGVGAGPGSTLAVLAVLAVVLVVAASYALFRR